MKILMIGAYKPQLGGVSMVVQNLAAQFKKDHNVYVINMEEGLPTRLKFWNDNGVKVYQEKMIFPKRYKTFQTLFQTTKRALLLQNKVDIYHAHGPFYAGVGFIDKRKPLVLTFHGYPSLETANSGRIRKNSLQFKFIRYMERKTAERADAVIAVGRTLRRWIIEELKIPPENVFYIPNGIDPNLFKPIPREKNPLKDKIKGRPILLFTKHFSPIYGAKELILAFKMILKVYSNAKLVMVGNDQWRRDIENFVIKNNLPSYIYFPGKIENQFMPYFYSIADIFINPTITQETFGISLIEAMACEKPVIATAVGGPKEIIEDGYQQMGAPVGILVPPQDPDSIAEAVFQILENTYEAKSMGKRAREYVIRNYTWDIVEKKTLEVYKLAMNNS